MFDIHNESNTPGSSAVGINLPLFQLILSLGDSEKRTMNVWPVMPKVVAKAKSNSGGARRSLSKQLDFPNILAVPVSNSAVQVASNWRERKIKNESKPEVT